MTPLDAARQMFSGDVTENFDRECPFCGIGAYPRDVKKESFPHTTDCPWLQMPQIVKALELQPHLLRVYAAAKNMIVTGFSASPGGSEDEIAGYRRVRKELFAAIQDIDDFADAQRAATDA